MRYSGKLGVVEQTEVRPGVWEDVVKEYDVLGDVKQRTEALIQGSSILPTYRTTTSVSVPARGVGPIDNSMIRYLTYKGTRWQIATIVDKPPRLVLYIGEEYHGPTPIGTPDNPEGP